MKESDPIDLSALDPMQDPEHWHAFVDATLGRVDRAMEAGSPDAITVIAGWARPVLMAAAAAVALLVPIELALEQREDRVEQVERLVSLSLSLDSETPPTGSDFLRALAEERP